MPAFFTYFTSAYGLLMIAALGYSLLSGRNIDLGTVGLYIFPLVAVYYAVYRGISAPNLFPSLRSNSERTRFSSAIAFGTLCAIGVSKMGPVASVGFLLAICVGALCSIAFGGQFCAFYAAVFGSTLFFIILLILEVQLHIRLTTIEYLEHLGISVIAPTMASQIATWCIAHCMRPDERAQTNHCHDSENIENSEQGVPPNDR